MLEIRVNADTRRSFWITIKTSRASLGARRQHAQQDVVAIDKVMLQCAGYMQECYRDQRDEQGMVQIVHSLKQNSVW